MGPPPSMKAPRHPPAYSVAAQMARLHRLGRVHSHEGVTSAASVDTFYMENGEEEDGKYLVFYSCTRTSRNLGDCSFDHFFLRLFKFHQTAFPLVIFQYPSRSMRPSIVIRTPRPDFKKLTSMQA